MLGTMKIKFAFWGVLHEGMFFPTLSHLSPQLQTTKTVASFSPTTQGALLNCP